MLVRCRRRIDFESPQDAWITAEPNQDLILDLCQMTRAIYFFDGEKTANDGQAIDWSEVKQIAAAASAEQAPNPGRLAITREAPAITKMLFRDAADVHDTLSGAFAPLGSEATLEFHNDPARCCIYHDPRCRRLIVVFRGTADWADVKDDLRLATAPWPPDGYGGDDRGSETGSRVNVVTGFVEHFTREDSHTTIFETVHSILDREAQRGKEHTIRDLHICGHSLGAATAVLLASILRRPREGASCCPRITVVTFGCPRVGNTAFVHQLLGAQEGCSKVRHWRVQNQLDLISRLPYWLPPRNDWEHGQSYHIWIRRKMLHVEDRELFQASSGMNSMTSCCAGASSSPRVHKLGGPLGYVAALRAAMSKDGPAVPPEGFTRSAWQLSLDASDESVL